jgi:hypothetical protein
MKKRDHLYLLALSLLFIGVLLLLITPRIMSSSELRLVTIPADDGASKKFSFAVDGKELSYKNVMDLLRSSNPEIVDLLTKEIKFSNYESVYWEVVPITARNFDKTKFEFVILEAYLEHRSVDGSPFYEHFTHHCNEKTPSVVTFKSLNKDATMVVPCPYHDKEDNDHMSHLKSFLAYSSSHEITQLWSTMARTLNEELMRNAEDPDKTLWLSTSGGGVAWLHIRIDTRPKYYNHREYKNSLYQPL